MSGEKPRREWVPLDRLIRDPRLQMRASLADGLTDPATVERYREEMADGDVFPPLEVVSDGASYWLVDGFQRAAALECIGKGSAECTVHAGTHDDALLLALGANARHGLTRTAQDCRRALATLLNAPELLHKVLARAAERGGVYRAVAAVCGVSKGLVYKVLEERGLHVVGGMLLKKRIGTILPTASAAAESQTSPPDAALLTANDASLAPTVSADSSSARDSAPIRELDRALGAIAILWTACRGLLDGPWSAHLMRYALTHGIPFCRSSNPNVPLSAESSNVPLSTLAWWEPLGKIEAVLADLYAIAAAEPCD